MREKACQETDTGKSLLFSKYGLASDQLPRVWDPTDSFAGQRMFHLDKISFCKEKFQLRSVSFLEFHQKRSQTIPFLKRFTDFYG